jgi:AmiR/NasT family two-component response regulator
VFLAERRAGAQSELSTRLRGLGHDVVGRVTSGRAAVEYAHLLAPDAVLFALQLDDGPGLIAAMAVIRARAGVAAVVLNDHPAALTPSARPNWGAVAMVAPAGAADDLEATLRATVARARESSPENAVPNAAQDAALDAILTPTFSSVAVPVAAPKAETQKAEIQKGVPQKVSPPKAAPKAQPVNLTPIVNRAIDALAQRSQLSSDAALALMRQEADDSGQSLDDIAAAIVGEDEDQELARKAA